MLPGGESVFDAVGKRPVRKTLYTITLEVTGFLFHLRFLWLIFCRIFIS